MNELPTTMYIDLSDFEGYFGDDDFLSHEEIIDGILQEIENEYGVCPESFEFEEDEGNERCFNVYDIVWEIDD